jgi:hypothetical protein
VLLSLLVVTPALADRVILGDGANYNGQFTPLNGEIKFSDSQGIEYKFPVCDVQSIVFSSTTDIVTLRSGKIYSGQYTGPDALCFQDSQRIQYQFPLKDVETLVLTQTSPRLLRRECRLRLCRMEPRP